MVIVRLKGGLGNQMFQYAMARRIAYKNRVPLKLDITWFNNTKNDTSRVYELKHLQIVEDFASEDEIGGFVKNKGLDSYVSKITSRFLPLSWRTYIRERKFSFDPDILRLPGNVYLDGVWGTEKYFMDIKEIIQHEFALRNPSNEVNKKMGQLIESVASVAVHVRRGDYVSNPITNRYHGVCSLEYYDRAVAEIAKMVKEPHFFIFSDDLDWVRNNLKFGFPAIYLNHNSGDQGHEDMKLMSLCRHNIIANSTFSWWGAWLNKNPDKLVYAPAKWFNTKKLDTKDLLPISWKKL